VKNEGNTRSGQWRCWKGGDDVDDVEAEVGLKEGGMLKGCLCGGGGTRESKRGRGCCSLTASAPIRTSSIKR